MSSSPPIVSLDSYSLIYEGDGTDTVPTAFPIGGVTGTINLQTPSYGGAGTETRAEYLELLFTMDGAGTGTVELTGACDNGPEEYICSLALSAAAGTAETGSWDWVDSITLTNEHLSKFGIRVADSGNSRVAKFGVLMIGYKYLTVYSTAIATASNLRVYARYFN